MGRVHHTRRRDSAQGELEARLLGRRVRRCVLLQVLGVLGCRPDSPDEATEFPETLVDVPRVSAALPLEGRAMRLGVGTGEITLDLRPLGRSLPAEQRRFVRDEVISVESPSAMCAAFSSALALAAELGHASVVDLEVAQDVTLEMVGFVFQSLIECSRVESHRFIVRSEIGVGMLSIDQRLGPVCRAAENDFDCAKPHVSISSQGIQVDVSAVARPTEPGCKFGVRRGRPLDEGWLSERVVPAWAGRVVLIDHNWCPTIPAQVHESSTLLATVLDEIQRFGPGCSAATLSAAADVTWNVAAEALALLGADAGYEFIRLNTWLTEDDVDCRDGVMVAHVDTP